MEDLACTTQKMYLAKRNYENKMYRYNSIFKESTTVYSYIVSMATETWILLSI